jgi:hypothetical protein
VLFSRYFRIGQAFSTELIYKHVSDTASSICEGRTVQDGRERPAECEDCSTVAVRDADWRLDAYLTAVAFEVCVTF